jgi:2-polyprenyl-3-methyl-5-hydroxy-6-metoxy-1,4-benzoquinol methylase
MAVNHEKLNELLGKAVVDIGATFHSVLVLIGEKHGLYKALAAEGPITAAELAKLTATAERYVAEWLAAQAAGGYVTYDDSTGKFSMTDEQAFALAQEDSPVYLPGAFQVALAASKARFKLEDAFHTGTGVGWHEHDTELFQGTERFFRSGYAANLISSWIPALSGVQEKLMEGARVADVGCGHGSSTILMAQAFPKSKFFGFDYHPASIETARNRAKEAGVQDRVNFEVTAAKEYPGEDYDFVTFFDCLHDMGDPIGAATHVRKTLKQSGTFMLVEPFAQDDLAQNLNPVGRMYYSASTLICTPASRSQEVGMALGAQAGEKRLRDVLTRAGFTHFRRATETPFNLIFEVRP